MDDLSVEDLLLFLSAERRALKHIAHDLRRPRGWFFNWRKHMSTASDRVNAVTTQLDAIANQFPAAVGAALVKARADGQAAGDPDLDGALTALEAQTTATTAALQASIAPPVADPSASA